MAHEQTRTAGVNSTRTVMTASSGALLVAAMACLFAPIETLTFLGMSAPDAVAGQMLGALFLALAAANWTARASMIGGIYARPLSVANFIHFVVGATILAKGIPDTASNPAYLTVVGGYILFAVAFALVLFGRLQPRAGSRSTRP